MSDADTDDLRAWLSRDWAALCPGQPDLGADLIARYSEPWRYYHDVEHLGEVIERLDLLEGEAGSPRLVRLAAWFHDAVYDPRAADNEEQSARLAESTLREPAEVVAEVARLVRLTATHAAETGDRDGAVLCDADLAILATDVDRYDRYTAAVRREYAHVTDQDFRRGRAQVLRQLLALPQLFATPTGYRLWEDAASHNVERELRLLED